MALAVAGALTAPALAYAQASTVQIYGSVRLEYARIDEGGTRNSFDRLNNPGSSFIGFRGEEKLGGGMSAWFQIESTFVGDGAGQSQPGNWADRNTAVGLRGNFGNVFFGQWDTPYKLASGSKYRPFDTTGITGIGAIMHNETTTGANSTVTTPTGTFTDTAGNTVITTASVGNATSFHRRQSNSLNYHTPTWNGFTGMVAYGAKDETTGTVAGAAEPRTWSLGATFERGPFYIGAGYERHSEYRTLAAGTFGDDTGWIINAAYTFGGVFKLGGVFERLEYETGVGVETKRDAWGLYGDWKIAGPHTLRLGYTQARDSKGGGAAVNSIGRAVACGTAGSTVTTQAGATVCGQDNGAKMYSIMYAYALSKRTEVNVAYSRLNNDSAGLYRLHGTTRSTGQDMTALGVGIRHSF
jgi:predicted porin